MRIIQVIPTLAAGGAETLVADLASAQAAAGHEVYLFLLCGIKDDRGALLAQQLVADGATVIKPDRFRSARNPRSILDLYRLIIATNPHVVHSHLHAAEFVSAIATTPTHSRRRTVRTLHSTEYALGTNSIASFIASHSIAATVACSSAVAAAFRKKDASRTSRTISVVPNGVRFAFGPSSVRRTERATTSFKFLMIGAFRGATLKAAQKGHDIAIQALAYARKRGADVSITFAGDGPLRANAENLAYQLGVADRTDFVGVVPSVWEVMRAHDALLMPSRWEGLPITLLEAAGIGLPAIVSRIDSIVDADRDYPWVYARKDDAEDVARAIDQMLREHTTLSQRAADAIERVHAEFSIRRTAAEYEGVYQSLQNN